MQPGNDYAGSSPRSSTRKILKATRGIDAEKREISGIVRRHGSRSSEEVDARGYIARFEHVLRGRLSLNVKGPDALTSKKTGQRSPVLTFRPAESVFSGINGSRILSSRGERIRE